MEKLTLNEDINQARIKRLLIQAVSEIHDDQQVFTKEEAARFLRISTSALERWAFKKKEIAYSKPSKHAVFLRADLLKFLEKRRIPSIYDEGV